MEVTKFRPICLKNVAGKVLKKLRVNRIKHFVQRKEHLNCNQYGFTPQKSAIDPTIEVTDYLEEVLGEWQIVTIVTIDVKGAFDSACWPNIMTLQKHKCPKNLYKLKKVTLAKGTLY